MTRRLTKFILHGGNTAVKAKNNAKFFHEIGRGLKPQSTILAVYFGLLETERANQYSTDRERLTETYPTKAFNLVLASSDPVEFKKQAQAAQAIYFGEGDE